jgi:hypothetical protein
MRRPPVAGLDLGVYVAAVPLLLRNPSIIVVPLLMAVIGVLVAKVVAPSGGGMVGNLTAGLGGFLVLLLELFGLGAACVIADDAWRHGRASFDKGWGEARRRGGEILFAALGMTLLFWVAQYAGALIGGVIPYFGLLLMAAAALFLIWAIPAAAVGGVPGGAAIQISIDRVRANPAAAVLATVVVIALFVFALPIAGGWISILLIPYQGGFTILGSLIGALLQAIALGYVALVITKTYTDAAFTRRW